MKNTTSHTEALLQPALPSHPWERYVATDLFQLKGKSYLLVDYYSKYVEVQTLSSTTSTSVVASLKAIFSRHGIPTTFVSDKEPQFSSEEMRTSSKEYGFQHITSSPYYPKSNGQAERTVKTVKHLLGNSTDPYLVLLSYRATSLPFCGLGPAELSIIGHKIRTDLPQPQQNLLLEWSYIDEFAEQHKKFKADQKRHHDMRY